MDGIQKCFCCCHRNQKFILSIMFLLILSSTHFRFIAEGRAIPSSNQSVQQITPSQIRAQMIGSRPPRCNFRCSSCGPCQPIQVPVNPQLHNRNHGRARGRYHHYEAREIASSRGDDVTNYKPMGWKCKCGNLIFNP